jgi:hypothetical protein
MNIRIPIEIPHPYPRFVRLQVLFGSCYEEKPHTEMVLGSFPSVFTKMDVGFNPRKETAYIQPIWICLPRLPVELWNKDVLNTLGDGIGKFLSMEANFHSKVDKKVIKILVEIDLHKGLLEEIEKLWEH